MDHSKEWTILVFIIIFYSFLLGFMLTRERFRKMVVGYGRHRRGQYDEPVVLPYAVAIWTALTMAGIFTAHVLYGNGSTPSPAPTDVAPQPTPPPPYIVKIPGSLGSSAHAFFSIGWMTGLALFGISIDSWGLYAAVCIYQLTRAVLGSMVANIFVPFYADTINKDRVSKYVSCVHIMWHFRPTHHSHPQHHHRKTERHALFGAGLTKFFTWWSSLTDILISASQIDLAILTLVATLGADVGYGYMRIHDADGEDPPPAPVYVPVQQPVPSVVQSYTNPANSARRRSPSPVNKTYGAVVFVVDQRT